MHPRLSVVLPTHNRENLVSRAVDSVLAQSFSDFELILVDDYSTDGTREVLERYRDTSRVQLVFSDRNLGASGARNLGLSKARGELITFQDSDDYWMPHKLKLQVEALDASPECGICYCGSLYYKDKNSYYIPDGIFKKLDGDISSEILNGNTTSTQTFVIRKAILDQVGIFDSTLDPIEDWDLMIRVAQVTQFRFIPEPLVIIYGTPGSISSFRANNASARGRILDKHRERFSRQRAVSARQHYIAGRIWQNLGVSDRALSEFRRSFSELAAGKDAWADRRKLRLSNDLEEPCRVIDVRSDAADGARRANLRFDRGGRVMTDARAPAQPGTQDLPRVSIVVVNYNTRDLTLQCLRSVYAEGRRHAFELIVVDNASTDGSAEAIPAEFPGMRFVASTENLGFAAGNNLAAAEARGEWLLLLNPDTVVLDGAVDTLLDFASEHEEAAIFGGRTLFADGSLNPTSCWARATLWSSLTAALGLTAAFRGSRLFDPEAMGNWDRDTVRKVDIVTGCFFLLRRSIWEGLGGFDERFHMYGEETDLCLRAAQVGLSCMICPDAQIVHYGGASEKARAGKMVRLFRAKSQLYSKHWSASAAWLGMRMLDLWALVRIVALGGGKLLGIVGGESLQTWLEVWRNRQKWHLVRGEMSGGAPVPAKDRK